MIAIIYILACIILAFLGWKKDLGFFRVFILGFALTPIASCIHVFSKGKISVAAIVIVCILLSLPPTIYFLFLRDPLCNSIMEGLDYSSSSGTQVVTLDVDADTYSWEYIPYHLEARHKEDVGYVLEVRYGITAALYTGLARVEGEVIYAKLIDCDTGRIISENTFTAEFPHSISSDTKKVYVHESDVSDWVDSFFP